jgi:hypothetical protein
MSTLQDSIAEKFLATLMEAKQLDQHVIDQLRLLLAEEGKPKVDELVKVFASLPEKEVK